MDGVTSTGPTATLDSAKMKGFTFYVTASDVTVGGTLRIQALAPYGVWCDLDIRQITRNGDLVISIEGVFSQLRANLTERLDGTYTVQYEAFS